MCSNRRQHRRLQIRFLLTCSQISPLKEDVYKGLTLNISTGGICFETAAKTFEPGDLVKLELLVPPTVGVLELGGKINAFAMILRTERINGSSPQKEIYNRCAVAAQFCQTPSFFYKSYSSGQLPS
jgi:hypothetical protein